jgi:RTX calcium-binding nonapeptide repeat (4 copies)
MHEPSSWFEPLEARVLMSAALHGGSLTINGTNGADDIHLAAGGSAGQVIVFGVDGVSEGEVFEGVRKIKITTGGGNDHVVVDTVESTGRKGGPVGVKVNVGTGDDYVRTGDGKDVLVGGDGDDVLDAGGGNDRLYGQLGNDVMFGGDGNDKMFGSIGRDEFYGEAGRDVMHGNAGEDLLQDDTGQDARGGGRSHDTKIDLPLVRVKLTDASGDEAGDPIEFTFSRSGDTAQPFEVFFQLIGSATQGDDYTASVDPPNPPNYQSIVIPAGVSSAVLRLTPIDDALPEGDENVRVMLTPTKGEGQPPVTNYVFAQVEQQSDPAVIHDNDV